jgi:hypothetical protein
MTLLVMIDDVNMGCSLVNNNEAWRGRGLENWPRVLGNSCSSQVRKGGEIGLNQSLLYIHPFLPNFVPIFFPPLFQLSTQTKNSKAEK